MQLYLQNMNKKCTKICALKYLMRTKVPWLVACWIGESMGVHYFSRGILSVSHQNTYKPWKNKGQNAPLQITLYLLGESGYKKWQKMKIQCRLFEPPKKSRGWWYFHLLAGKHAFHSLTKIPQKYARFFILPLFSISKINFILIFEISKLWVVDYAWFAGTERIVLQRWSFYSEYCAKHPFLKIFDF